MKTKTKPPIKITWDFSCLFWMESSDDNLGTKYATAFIERTLGKPLNKYRVAALMQLIGELSIIGSKDSDSCVFCANNADFNRLQVQIQNYKKKLLTASPRLLKAATQWLNYLKVKQAITTD